MTIQPYSSIISTKTGNVFVMANANIFIEVMPMVSPTVRTFVGKTSTVHIDPNGTIPIDEMNITKAMLVTGTHLNIDMSYANDSQYKCVAMMKIPIVQPANDTIRSNFLP